MAVVIRMKRTGRRNAPCYRISVADSRSPRDGRTLETLGVYDPISPVENLRLTLDAERARHWLDHGALPSETVRSIFKKMGVYHEGELQAKPRRRPGRKTVTKGRERRLADQKGRAERKEARRAERTKAKREAAKAAAEGGGGE